MDNNSGLYMYCYAPVDLDVGQFCSIIDGYARPVTLGHAASGKVSVVGLVMSPMSAGEYGWVDVGIQFAPPKSRWGSLKDYIRKLFPRIFPCIRIR